MTVQRICSELTMIQREVLGPSFDNQSVIKRCSKIQRQIKALPSSLDVSAAKNTLHKIFVTLLQIKLRDFRDRITRLETLSTNSAKLPLIKQTFHETISLEKDLASKQRLFSPAMAEEFIALMKREKPLIARLKPICESSKTATITRLAKAACLGGLAFFVARSLEVNSLATLAIAAVSLVTCWKLFSPQMVEHPKDATVKIGQKEISIKHAMAQLVSTTNIPNMNHAELCDLLRRASIYFSPQRGTAISVQKLARIFVKDSIQVPDSIDSLAGIFGLQGNRNTSLFNDEKERMKRFQELAVSSKKFTKDEMRLYLPSVLKYKVGSIEKFHELPSFGAWTVRKQDGTIWELIYEGDSDYNCIIWPAKGREVAAEKSTLTLSSFLNRTICNRNIIIPKNTKAIYPGTTMQIPVDQVPQKGVWHVQMKDEKSWQLQYVEPSDKGSIIWPVGDRNKPGLKVGNKSTIYPGDKVISNDDLIRGTWTVVDIHKQELIFEGLPHMPRTLVYPHLGRGFDKDKYSFRGVTLYPDALVKMIKSDLPREGNWTVLLENDENWILRFNGPSRFLSIKRKIGDEEVDIRDDEEVDIGGLDFEAIL